MSVQYYRKFAKYRENNSPDLTVEAEFVLPCSVFYGDRVDFGIKLVRLCRNTKTHHFIAYEGMYKLDPGTKRFQQRTRPQTVMNSILQIVERYSWLFDQNYFDKLVRASLVIPLNKASEKDKLKTLLTEIRGCASAALL